jgi:hypothetical protein
VTYRAATLVPPEGEVDSFGRCYSTTTGRAYIGTRPAKKSIAKVRRTNSELTSQRRTLIDTQEQVVQLNRLLVRLGQLLLSGSGQQGIPVNR